MSNQTAHKPYQCYDDGINRIVMKLWGKTASKQLECWLVGWHSSAGMPNWKTKTKISDAFAILFFGSKISKGVLTIRNAIKFSLFNKNYFWGCWLSRDRNLHWYSILGCNLPRLSFAILNMWKRKRDLRYKVASFVRPLFYLCVLPAIEIVSSHKTKTFINFHIQNTTLLEIL